MFTVWLIISFVVMGCSAPARERPARAPGSAPPAAPASEPSPPVERAGVTKVAAIVSGVLQRSGVEIEICPAQSFGPCPGIRVLGDVDPAWLTTDPAAVSTWRLRGDYDGKTLVLAEPAQRARMGQAPDYRNRCPELQQRTRSRQLPQRATVALAAFASEHRERFAGQWWDAERQTMVVSVTGDAADLTARLRARTGAARVCLQGGARLSAVELDAARERADRVLQERAVVWSGSSLDVVNNRVVYDVEVIDAATLEQLTREAGESIQVLAFIELPNHRLDQLPRPAARGNVELVTAEGRSGAGMSALGRFTLRYDEPQRCMYLEDGQGARVLPVWPFGYWATSHPGRVHDFDDHVVVEVGGDIELGGGQVDIESVRAKQPCGAKHAWIGAPNSAARKPGESACGSDGLRRLELPQGMHVRGPCALAGGPVQGIDSLIGRFQMPGCQLEYDFGAYSSTLDEWKGHARYARRPTTLDGREAQLVTAHRDEPSAGERPAWLAGVHVADAPHGQKLALYSECSSQAGQRAMLELLQTLRFSK